MQDEKDHISFKEYYEQFKAELMEEVFPDGFRKFPRDFYPEGISTGIECDVYPTNGKPLVINSFFDRHELKDDDGKTIVELDSILKAEFAVILSCQETYVFRIPRDEKLISNLLEAYRTYIKEVKQRLVKAAMKKVADKELAEKVTREIIEDSYRSE